MKTVPVLLACTCLCAALAACTGGMGRVRDDLGRPATERLRTGTTIVGRGCVAVTGKPATDRFEADQAARAEVAKQLEVKITQAVEDFQREEQVDAERTHVYSIKIQTEEFVQKTLKGVRITERKRNEEQGLQCAVAVLDKKAMAFQLRKEIEGDLDEIHSHLAGAEDALRAKNRVEALRGYSLAMLSLDRVGVNAKLMLGLGYSPPPVPSRADIARKWMGVLQAIRLVRAGGEAQRGRPGRGLAKPLRVLALGPSGEPVPNLPLKPVHTPQGCDVQLMAETGADGEAELRVYRVASNGKALEEIAIGIDWQRLLGAGPLAGDSPPQWARWDTRQVIFTYRMPVPGEFRVGVAIFETGTDRPLRSSPIQSLVLEGLQATGFKTRNLFEEPALGKRPTPTQVRRFSAGKVDFLVLGEVSLRLSSETSGLTFYRAEGLITVIAPATGRTVVSLDIEAKGGGLDDDRAARKALGNLARKLGKGIGPALAGTLE